MRFIELRNEKGSFSDWLRAFSDGKTILYDKHGDGYIPASNGLSERISAELRRRGFKYLGSVTVYSHLQACGIINDHGCDCPRYAVVNAATATIRKRRNREQGIVIFGKSKGNNHDRQQAICDVLQHQSAPSARACRKGEVAI